MLHRILPVALLLSAACASAPPAGAPTPDEPEPLTEEQEVLAVLDSLFSGMRQLDTAQIRTVFHPEARLIATSERDGQPRVQIIPISDFIQSIAGAQGYLDEQLFDPEVDIDGNLAQVWTYYRFDLAGHFSHCGFDGFQLARTADGWKIVSVADTRHTDPDVCAEIGPRAGSARAGPR